jgi:hypothetical protein
VKKPVAPLELRKFVHLSEEPEGVINRIGRGTWDLVVVDVKGNWERAVFASDLEAATACAELAIPVNHGWDARLARRMNALDAWATPGAKHRAL